MSAAKRGWIIQTPSEKASASAVAIALATTPMRRLSRMLRAQSGLSISSR